MKIKHLLIAAFACAALAACEKTPVENPGVDNELGETSYLSVKIGNVPTTRAEVPGTMEDGSVAECKVNTVRLYFFDVNGNAANCVANATGYQNYYDFVNPTNADVPNANDNIDDKVAAVVVISTAKGDLLPAKVAAVINGPTEAKAYTVETLRKEVADYSSTTNGFVMSSTTYAKENARVDVVELTTANFFKKEEDARNTPVAIYVERVLAKVRVDAGEVDATGEYADVTLSDGTILYNTGKTADKRPSGTPVYVKYVGWLPTATANTSYLVKNIDATWTNETLFAGWSFSDYYRSYWAINPDGLAVSYYTYNEIAANKSFDGVASVYCQENAPAVDGVRTKLIVAAQLVDKTGVALNISEWNGFRYNGDDVKTAMLEALQAQGIIIKIGENAITVNDLVFKTEADMNYGYGHLVFAQLRDLNEGETAAVTGSDKTANALLEGLGGVKYWNNGMTYYYTDIKHLGDAGKLGEYGVVRNHIYNINLTNVTGLGTPVYDPGQEPGTDPDPEEIIPEKPADEESYLAAEINILSWRVVDQDVELK